MTSTAWNFCIDVVLLSTRFALGKLFQSSSTPSNKNTHTTEYYLKNVQKYTKIVIEYFKTILGCLGLLIVFK
jgi:hypothetical protein